MSNAKKMLINNAIAIGVYGLTLALAIWLSYTAFHSSVLNIFTIGFYAAILCILCGVVLFPVKKRTFLSILPVSIAFIVFALAFLTLSRDTYAGFIFLVLNPFSALFFS